jgi:hypothetical protein
MQTAYLVLANVKLISATQGVTGNGARFRVNARQAVYECSSKSLPREPNFKCSLNEY